MTDAEAIALYCGLVPPADKLGDPGAARRKMEAMRDLPKVTKLMNAATDLQGFVLGRKLSGKPTDAEDYARLRVMEALADLEGIDKGRTLPDAIRSLRFELGVFDND